MLAQHKGAFNTVEKYLTESPVLKYYSVNDEVTIQCDAADTGLGAVLMQNGQPMCYASRALTGVEGSYVQIGKKLLAIVWSCHKFHQYIYMTERSYMSNLTMNHYKQCSRSQYISHLSDYKECAWHCKITHWTFSARKAK